MADCAGAAVTFEGDQMRVRFDRFGMDAYRLFLRCKALPESVTEFHPEGETYSIVAPARFAPMLGVEVPAAGGPELPLSPFLFDDQAAIVRMFLSAKRFACWSGCGSGKTLIGLECARHVHRRTGGRVLIVTLNEIVPQWLDEAARFFGDALPLVRLTSREEMRRWCKEGPGSFAITNYEKWNPEDLDSQIVSEARHLAGIVLDESSRLKAGGGKQKWALIKSCRGIEYKLSLTATPAPNDLMEFASQASFLEKMRSEGEIIWTYFMRDPKTHRWTVKDHARAAFFRFMSSWSIYVRDPRRYGWRQNLEPVPEPVQFVHEVPMTAEQREHYLSLTVDPDGQTVLFRDDDRAANAIQRMKMSQVAKGFRYVKGSDGKPRRVPKNPATGSVRGKMPRWEPIHSLKPGVVADLVRQEAAAGLQVLVWTQFDAEGEILAGLLKDIAPAVLSGATKPAERLDTLERFRSGQLPVLISKAALLGFGMNFQCCGSMVFSGYSDSYESFYQAVRRAYRHGQTRRLRVHVPVIRELEGEMWDNLCRKADQHEKAIEEMERNYVAALKEVSARL